MLKIAIVEDEKDQSEILKKCIERYSIENGEECQVSFFSNGIDFLSDYEKDTDVVFLDIMMPLEDGLSIAKKIRKENQTIIIIFVTNMKEYAIEGYSVNAFNFMLKPVVYSDFYLNLKKISKIKDSIKNKFVLINAKGKTYKIDSNDILYIEMFNHDVNVVLRSGTITFRGTIKEMEEILDSESFSRCHNSCIVNLKHVDRVKNDIIYINITKKELYISRNRKKAFMNDFANYIIQNRGIVINRR